MLKLCYVEDQWAYFSPQDPTKLFYDDWDDAPYEHNASAPYGTDIVVVAFSGPFYTPAHFARSCNSPYSAQQINRGAIAWLSPSPYDDVPNAQYIHAGVSLEEFKAAIKAMGGEIYVREE
ncbi:MAG: hypothetical protein GYA36_23205 [Veillonellaceae bacterium]|nr:hypothetical protein [Veillonellaceae bacterium]